MTKFQILIFVTRLDFTIFFFMSVEVLQEKKLLGVCVCVCDTFLVQSRYDYRNSILIIIISPLAVKWISQRQWHR